MTIFIIGKIFQSPKNANNLFSYRCEHLWYAPEGSYSDTGYLLAFIERRSYQLTSRCPVTSEQWMEESGRSRVRPSRRQVGTRLRLKCDGTRAEIRFRLSVKRTSPFKSAEASVQSTTGSRGVRISGSNAGYTMFRGSVKGTGYPLHSPVSPSLPLPCVTVCHHVTTGLYNRRLLERMKETDKASQDSQT